MTTEVLGYGGNDGLEDGICQKVRGACPECIYGGAVERLCDLLSEIVRRVPDLCHRVKAHREYCDEYGRIQRHHKRDDRKTFHACVVDAFSRSIEITLADNLVMTDELTESVEAMLILLSVKERWM